MVRVVRLERTVSWSQTRRDTNFAIPGYSFFCHDTTASGKNKDFSVCGHLCGQSRFCAVFGNRGKSSKRRCRKALRRFASPYPGYRHGTPKASALPTALHPVMKFSNCGQTCGQRRFLTSYRRGGKCCQPKCPKAFRDFRELCLEPEPHAPKPPALPTALIPDIRFSA